MFRRCVLAAVLCAIVVVSTSRPSAAQEASPDAIAAARELMGAMRTDQQFNLLFPLIMKQLKPAIAQGNPQVERDFDALLPGLSALAKERSGELVDATAMIYARSFTTDELRQLTAFYRGELGQKLLARIPEITQQSLAVGQKFGATIAAELRSRMIEELRKRGHKI